MENISPRQSGKMQPPMPPRQPSIKRPERTVPLPAQVDSLPKRVGYGLPCSNCRTYYTADLNACPVCKSTERVSAAIAPVPAHQLPDEPIPTGTTLEEERERFLKEFKSQIYAAHMQINAAASFRCSLEENHEEAYEPAAVCQTCYTRIQEQVDQMEAALHIDLKEAAQIVYDAVWSDTSNSNKTYLNAAHALLSELRKRAGISLVISPLKPLAH
jgi:hypothetical protein